MKKELNRRSFMNGMAALGTMGLLGLNGIKANAAQQLPTHQRKDSKMSNGLILFGVDGLDPEICQTMMKAGDLPNLSRLASRGSFRPLGTSNPPQSPVAWASMATSLNPGRHGVYDFLTRNSG